MSMGESMIRAVDWSSHTVLSGTEDDLGSALAALLASEDPESAEATWWRIENVVFSQDTIYSAAEPTVDVVLAALADERPRFIRSWLLELLFFIMKGGSLEDPELPGRCRSRARRGLWLLAREATATSGPEQDLVMRTIEYIDPDFCGLVRRTQGET